MVLSIAVFFFSTLGLLDEINASYVDSVYELPEATGIPSVNWQHNGHIRGWIDIVGFRHMACFNGSCYVLGKPADNAIVQYDAQADSLCGWCVLVSLKKTLSVNDRGNTTTAVLRVELSYNEIITNCDENSCWTTIIPHSETAYFQAYAQSPLMFDADKERVEIQNVHYNHSLYAEQLIYANTSELITLYNVSFSTGWIVHRLQIGQIEYTAKGIPYANFSLFDTWKKSGSGINYLYKAVVINDINGSYLFQAYSPFGVINKTTVTHLYNSWSPGQAITPFTFLIIFIVGVAFYGIDRMRRNL